MTDRELMQQALEALNRSDYLGWQLNIPIIKALHERLAQPEQEPVAWLDSDGFPWSKDGVECRTTQDTYIPLYTAPPKREWVGLTGLEQKELMAMNSRDAVFETEAKLKEKNT